MTLDDHLAAPDQHLDPEIAARYDVAAGAAFSDEEVASAVDRLAALADGGAAVEFAIGTGRIAIPLAARGVEVNGMDISAPMLAELRRKPGAEAIDAVVGDMTDTQVRDDAALVYLVYNTIGNLRTQERQVACFANAAAHLRPGGRFVIEVGVPELHLLVPGESIRPIAVRPDYVGFDEYVDRVGQILVSHHYRIAGDHVRTVSGTFRYVWPSELDLMARLAGLTLEHRWADWHRNEFTADSPRHISVWRTP